MRKNCLGKAVKPPLERPRYYNAGLFCLRLCLFIFFGYRYTCFSDISRRKFSRSVVTFTSWLSWQG